MGAQPDLRLTWSFLSAIAGLWSQHPGSYKIEDEADDLIPALAQISIKALAAEVRGSIPRADQQEGVEGELSLSDGTVRRVTVRDIANKIVHGSPDRVVVDGGDVRLHFVNSRNDAGTDGWVELWFSAQSFVRVMHRLLHVAPHDSARRDQQVQEFILGLGPERFLPSQVAAADHG